MTCFRNYCFPSNEDCTLKKFWHEFYFCPKCELISYKVINDKHNAKIYTPIYLFSFLLKTNCFFLRGSILQYSNELYLCFLAFFSLSLLSIIILVEHNIKWISYCSLWQFNLLCVILQMTVCLWYFLQVLFHLTFIISHKNTMLKKCFADISVSRPDSFLLELTLEMTKSAWYILNNAPSLW